LSYNDKSFYINSLIVISIITVVIVLIDEYLLKSFDSLFLKIVTSLIVSLPLYLFFANSLIQNYKESKKRVKDLIDETLHELNTPIATIEANISLLQNSISNEKDLKRLKRIKMASNNLLNLYNENEALLKSEIELFEKEEFFIDEMIKISVDNFKEMIEKKDLKIELNLEKRSVYTNRYHFKKVIENLISNAIKYNRFGGWVVISLKNNTLTISDSGVGIDTKNLFIIYEKSYQENPSTKGFGLGLTIVKRYCDKERITIKIDTKKDIGTSIILDISKILV